GRSWFRGPSAYYGILEHNEWASAGRGSLGRLGGEGVEELVGDEGLEDERNPVTFLAGGDHGVLGIVTEPLCQDDAGVGLAGFGPAVDCRAAHSGLLDVADDGPEGSGFGEPQPLRSGWGGLHFAAVFLQKGVDRASGLLFAVDHQD